MMKRHPNFKLWLCRVISGGVWKQAGVALLLFTVALAVLALLYCLVPDASVASRTDDSVVSRISMAFSDMISPVSFREQAYLSSVPGRQPLWLLTLAYLAGTIVLSGLLIATITNILRTQAERFRQGKVGFRFRDHVLFLGYDAKLAGMVRRLCREGVRVVVAVRADAAGCYDELNVALGRRERRRLVVLCADRCNADDLCWLHAGSAARIYIVGTPGEETRDTLNMKSFRMLYELYGADAMPDCHVDINCQSTFAMFQTYAGGTDPAFDAAMRRFHSFNYYDEWARLMVSGTFDGRNGEPLAARGDKALHLVVAGMTEMGEAMAREAAFLCHYPSAVTHGVKTRITFIDRNARVRMDDFTAHYHHLFSHLAYTYRRPAVGLVEEHRPAAADDFLDLEFEFVDADLRTPAVRDLLVEWAADERRELTVAVCFERSDENIAEGVYLPFSLHERRVPVWVFQPGEGDLHGYLGGFNRFGNVVAFGMSDSEQPFRDNETALLHAKRLNHFYFHLDDPVVTYDNDEQEREWAACRVFDRWSSFYNVAAVSTKMSGIGGFANLNDENIEVMARVEHNRWNAEKLLMGFRPTTADEHAGVLKLGKAEKKRLKNAFVHDDIRPFDDLDQATADIDRRLTREIPRIVKV